MTVQLDTQMPRPIRMHEVAWQEAGPGLSSKPAWADPQTERRAYLGRIAAGARLPLHRHLGEELVYVVEGEVADESGTLVAGQASYRPTGCVHSLFVEKGTTVLIVVTGGTEPADRLDGAPPSRPINVGQIDWVESVPGVREKEIWADPAAQKCMRLLRFEPGAQLLRHRHLGDSLVFGIEGEISDQSGSLLPGDISYRPKASVHSVRSTNGATVLHFGWGGTEPVGR